MVNFRRDSDWSWTSEGMSPSHALLQAEELSSRQIAPARLESYSGEYRMDWQHYNLGSVDLNFLKVTPQQVKRTQSMTRQDGNVDCDLLLMRSGTGRMLHGKSSCDLEPGSLILLDCAQPWDLLFPQGSHCFTAHMDGSWLRRWLPDPAASAGIPIDAANPWAAPLTAIFSAIEIDGVERSPLPRSLLADQLGGLLLLAMGQSISGQGRHQNELVSRIRRAVRDRFDDHDLSAEMVAHDLGVSRRYLDRLLSGAGLTFLTLLEGERLNAARTRLTDHFWLKESIGAIAWSCGFTDPAYFARRFRRRFGVTPSQFRHSSRIVA